MKQRILFSILALFAFTATQAQVTFKPWADKEMTYLSVDGDIVGKYHSLVEGLPEGTYNQVIVSMNCTNLINVDNPADSLLLSVQDNLVEYTSIMVDGDEMYYSETTYNNDLISTINGEYEYIYIDNYGTAEDFAKVKDVLAGKIAVCNRGSVSFYEKANAAVENGAVGVIIVNNQEGSINMNLTGYKYDKPAVSTTLQGGAMLKNHAEYVTGSASYYRGTLTISDSKKYRHFAVDFGFGHDYESEEDYDVVAVVPDWAGATSGATYKAQISFNAAFYEYDSEGNYISESTLETKPTTLTLSVPANVGVDEATSGLDDDRMYNIMGVQVYDGYKGIVIKNGKKMLLR